MYTNETQPSQLSSMTSNLPSASSLKHSGISVAGKVLITFAALAVLALLCLVFIYPGPGYWRSRLIRWFKRPPSGDPENSSAVPEVSQSSHSTTHTSTYLGGDNSAPVSNNRQMSIDTVPVEPIETNIPLDNSANIPLAQQRMNNSGGTSNNRQSSIYRASSRTSSSDDLEEVSSLQYAISCLQQLISNEGSFCPKYQTLLAETG